MKKVWFIVLGSLGILGLLGGGCGWSAAGVMRRMLNNNLGDHKLFNWCTSGLVDLDRLLDNKTYYVMLQNNTELRATGGFMGSYAKINVQCSMFNVQCGVKSIDIQDIYVPDGQLPGHVEPPYPVQEAFKIGYWWLRDSNWDPDFASSAATIAWFLKQGNEPEPAGIVAINQTTVAKIIDVLGGVKVLDFDKTVTGQNLYSLAQRYAEEGFFPGSTKKKDFLGSVGGALVRKVKDAGLVELGKLGKLVWDELRKKQILVWIKDAEIRRWGGRLEDGWDKKSDYLYIVESNLGANKANCCMDRDVRQEIENNKVKLTITWKNENEFDATKPPVFWGGQYVNYNRVVIPSSHKIQAVKLQGRELRLATEKDFVMPNSLRQEMSTDMYNVEERGDLQIIGFWANVPAKKTITAELQYLTPDPSPNLGEGDKKREIFFGEGNQYKILIKRQPGIEGFDYKLIYNGKLAASKWIDRDKIIGVK
ncbi:MAG: hypothetical protein G01um101416_258 [Microgenomates group bacterium Gr01-1014_16]|nr:MAG: hypothetical protein G01um101416_258 [Microgenomates group bacterium Gr01-1014_16]